MRRHHGLHFASFGFLSLLAVSASAQWIVPPEPFPPDRHLPPVGSAIARLESIRTEMTVRDQVATRTTRMAYVVSGGAARNEATVYLPFDAKAQVNAFAVTMNGQRLAGDLLDAEKSRRIYEDIVRQMRDPALLECYGSQLLRVRVFPLPPNGRFDLEIRTTELLPAEGGLVRVASPAAAIGDDARVGVRVSFRAEIRDSVPIRTVFSPGRAVSVTRPSDREAVVSWEDAGAEAGRSLVFYYGRADGEVGLNLVTYREGGEGWFLLLLAPGIAPDAARVVPKDVIFVVDTSGSMQEGGKIDQARRALAYCVSKLNSADRFNVISFSHAAKPWRDGLTPATPENLEAAAAHARRLEAAGGTAIHEALTTALDQILGRSVDDGNLRPKPEDRGLSTPSDGRVRYIAFLTDGLPTIGETDPDRILRDTAARARGRVRICSFGVGHDVNTRLLDALAMDGEGATDYVLPGEDIEVRMSAFQDKISTPVLADVRLRVDGVETDDLYPRRIGDLHRGGQIAVVGRFRGGGKADVELRGHDGERERSFRYPVRFEGSGTVENDFLPRLWAGRKVMFLLNEIKINGANREVVDEVVRLATRYGIVTPYTSFLITEDQPLNGPRPRREMSRRAVEDEFRKDAAEGYAGKSAVERAKSVQSASGSAAAGPPASAAPLDAMVRQEAEKANVGARALQERLQIAGGKGWYRQGEVWVDGSLDEKDLASGRQIAFGSEEYFRLLRENPAAAQYFKLGQQVSFRMGNEVVHCR